MRSSFRLLAAIALILTAATAVAKTKKQKTQLALDVKPATALVYVDGHAQGKASPGKVIDVTPGLHVVRLVFGRDEHEEQIKFFEGKATTYTYEFEGGEPVHPAKDATSAGTETEPVPGIQPSDKSTGGKKGPPQPEDDPTAGGRWPADEDAPRTPPPTNASP